MSKKRRHGALQPGGQAPATARRPRNPVARNNALLGKSAAHGKSRKALRRRDRVALGKSDIGQAAARPAACPMSFGAQLRAAAGASLSAGTGQMPGNGPSVAVAT